MEARAGAGGAASTTRALGIVALLCAIALGLTSWGHHEPAPLASDAPKERFSAGRARAIEARVLGDGRPHPVGSAANRAVRDRVVAELAAVGLTPTIQRAVGCSRSGACAWVENVVATIEGREAGPAVLLVAHYDGVGAGPGASDDGAGVAATIEAARALVEGPRPRNTVLVLVDDGEERGLCGADAFAREHPLASRVAFVVNLEARGSHGPSTLFETGGADAWLVDLARGALDHPVTSSLLYEVYRRLPNDTDFTVLRERLGVRGYNLAYTRGVGQYHTPRDDLAHASAGSLQHHGDQALALVRALAAADLGAVPRADAAWFDVFGRVIVAYPLGATPALAAAALALVALAGVRRRRELGARGVALGAASVLLVPVVAAVVAAGFGRALVAAGAVPVPFVARPFAAELSLGLAGTAVVAACALALRRHATPPALAVGVALAFAAIGLALALVAPRVAFVAILPALAGGLAAHAPRWRGLDGVRVGALPVAATLSLAMLVLDLGAGIGLGAPAAQGVVAALATVGLVPLCAGAGRSAVRLAGALAFCALVALGVAARTPPFDEDSPQRVNVVRVEDASAHDARWAIDAAWGSMSWGAPPPALVAALGPGARTEPRAPWSRAPWIAAPSPFRGAPPPDVVVDSSSPSRVAAHLRSRRGATSIRVHAPPDAPIDALWLESAPRAAWSVEAGWRTWAFEGVPDEGLALAVERRAGARVVLVVEDRVYGLAPGGEPLDAARGRVAAPSQDGDLDVVRATVTLD
jgi:hypothetical protein